MTHADPRHSYAALVAVGPGEREVERLRDLIAALGHYEPGRDGAGHSGSGHSGAGQSGAGGAMLVIVDDDPVPRHLDRLDAPAGLRLVGIHHRRADRGRAFSKGKGICSVVMTGLAWIHANADVRFVVKLDTDSLVIAPFRDRIVALLDRHPDVGMIGAYARTPAGGTRDWSPHRRPIRTLARHPFLRWITRRAPVPAEVGRHVRTLVRAASRHGYTPGEHCLGGGYALNAVLLDRMAAAGWLDTPHIWATVDLPEDVMLGLHVRAAGMGFLDHVDDGEVFGVSHIGLPFPPDALVRRGYAIIHAVKNDAIDEGTIRAYFRARRDDGSG